MKIVIAMDSFKGSLDSIQAGKAAEKGVRKVFEKAQIIVKPLADGGEGTMRALVEGLNGNIFKMNVLDPLGRKHEAEYGLSQKTAIMEMAQSSGIVLLKPGELDPWKADTFGLGQMILRALDHGVNKIILGIGGSATTEGGFGMLRALGARFYDKEKEELAGGFESLKDVETICLDGLDPRLEKTEFLIACDVNNPLTGSMGALSVFGPQKGVKEEEIALMDEMMSHYADVIARTVGKDVRNEPGAGAAGGLGFALLSFLPQAKLLPGISLVLDVLDYKEVLEGCDLLITGEGRIDGQSAMGKVPVGVAKLAKEVADAKTIAFAGSIGQEAQACNKQGIDAFFPVLRSICTLEEAMEPENARKNLEMSVEQVMRLLKG